MNRLLPHPITALILLLIWLLINQSIALGQLLLGALLAVSIPLLFQPLRPLADPHLRRPYAIWRLFWLSLWEVTRSCFNVSRIILFLKQDQLHSQFILVPLDLRDPYGLAMLACLINTNPGTVWVEIVPGGHDLALHVFDLQDEQWWIDTIKRHYEQPLIEIFEGRTVS